MSLLRIDLHSIRWLLMTLNLTDPINRFTIMEYQHNTVFS